MKTSIATGLVLVAIVAGIYFLYTSDMVSNYLKKSTEEITQTEPAPMPEEAVKEFGMFRDYFRQDLSEEEKAELNEVLADRDARLEDVHDILNKEFSKEEGDMDTAFEEAAKIREEIKDTLMMYVDENMKEAFEEMYRQLGRDLEAEYIVK